jgi:hypothetical protein
MQNGQSLYFYKPGLLLLSVRKQAAGGGGASLVTRLILVIPTHTIFLRVDHY